MFPKETILFMLNHVIEYNDLELNSKINMTLSFQEEDKQNRWFGWIQRYGEEKGYWTLEEIINLVRSERKE